MEVNHLEDLYRKQKLVGPFEEKYKKNSQSYPAYSWRKSRHRPAGFWGLGTYEIEIGQKSCCLRSIKDSSGWIYHQSRVEESQTERKLVKRTAYHPYIYSENRTTDSWSGPGVSISGYSIDCKINDLIDLIKIDLNITTKFKQGIELSILIEALESVCEWCHIALSWSGSAWLAD